MLSIDAACTSVPEPEEGVVDPEVPFPVECGFIHPLPIFFVSDVVQLEQDF